MKRITTLAIVVLSYFSSRTVRAAEVDPDVLRAEAQRVGVIARACEAAITVLADGGKDGGSGVIITADGYALSNFHVTEAAGIAMKCGLSNGQLYDAVIVGIDPVGDVALIKLFGRDDFPHAVLGDSDRLQTGDWAFTVGNPFLLATDFKPSVCYGIISGVHRYQYPAGTLLEYADCIQTDASINPGNSGGPLFNAAGELVGINGRGSFEKRGRVNVGVGYAISINQIKHFLGHLRGGRIVDHATLGAVVASDDQGHVLVSDILEDSDAFRRGLRYGDEIVNFGGRPIRTVNAFKNVLGIYPKGWIVPLSFRREAKTFDVFVRLAGVHGADELASKIEGDEKKKEDREVPKPSEEEDEKPESPDGKPRKHPGPERPGPKRPIIVPKLAAEPPKEVPEVVKTHYEKKRGYANYFFNRWNVRRVWDKFVASGDFASQAGPWTLEGRWITDNDSQFTIDETSVRCSLPGGELTMKVEDSLAGALEPPGSGGILAALYLWRRLLVHGPDQFGSVSYVGTAPLPGHEGLLDVMSGTDAAVECNFYFEPSSGRLVRLELFPYPDADPCELAFDQYEEFEGRWLPRHIEVRHEDRVYASLTFSKFKLDGRAKP